MTTTTASDSTQSSPMVLTPESTGASSTAASDAATKKARRQTAFYPNNSAAAGTKTQKPFSRSAAKRESVMALGSIEHLQHYFTKTGIAAKKNPLAKGNSGLVPALGPMNHRATDSLTVTPESPEFQLPPSPAVPNQTIPKMAPHVRHYETDPETLLPSVVDDLAAVSNVWHVSQQSQKPAGTDKSLLGAPGEGRTEFDVLAALKLTTQLIRTIRNYVLSLPDESTGTIRAQYRSKALTAASSQSKSSTNVTSQDPLTLIRRSALELLTVLRALEEHSRLPLSDDAYDAQSDGSHSRKGSTSVVSSPNMGAHEELPLSDSDEGSSVLGGIGRMDPDTTTTLGYSLVQVQGRYESVPVWEDEEEGFGVWDDELDDGKKREGWDERLVLGGGWLYRQDVRMEELVKEKGAVEGYLDVVDEVLFNGRDASGTGERGWEREKKRLASKGDGKKASRRRASAGVVTEGRPLLIPQSDARRRVSMGDAVLSEEPLDMTSPTLMEGIGEDVEGEESIDEDELPEWARKTAFMDSELDRAHALIHTFLPSTLLPSLSPSPSTSSHTDFLVSLTSGQLLCVAYNACVRKSKRPWGYISRDGIHDIVALEADALKNGEKEGEKEKKGVGPGAWTFRRIDNLRLWVGALKLRYMLPIQVPPQPHAVPHAPIMLATQSSSSGERQGQNGTANSSRTNTPIASPTSSRFPSGTGTGTGGQGRKTEEPPIFFDAKVVAKREEGWEGMLEEAVRAWVGRVVDEKRAEGR